MKSVVLGVSGSVAAYRACDLARELMRRGFEVRVCLTDAAQKFVSPALFEALTGQPCLIDTFEEPERGRMAHIDWARKANLLVIAPASASTLARIAHGIGDDMLTTLALAYEGPMLFAPAMNPSMYANANTQAAMSLLADRGAWFVEPGEGDVACGENGQGKLASIERIADEAEALAATSTQLRGKTVLITSGPTQEPIDSVRFLSNRSSGKMGAALAQAVISLGGDAVVVSGPVSVSYPRKATVIRVQTASEMLEAAMAHAHHADLIIGAAAVADYRPAEPVQGKIRRSASDLTVRLVPNPDIIAALAAQCPGKAVAFAAEPSDDLGVAREKIGRKGVYAIAVNDVSRGDIGFGSGDNELTLVGANGREARSGKRSKLACARWLLEQLAADG